MQANCINLWVSGSESPKMSELAAKCFMMHQQKKKGTIIKQPLLALMLQAAINSLDMYFTTFIGYRCYVPKITNTKYCHIATTVDYYQENVFHSLSPSWKIKSQPLHATTRCSFDTCATGKYFCNLQVNCSYRL